MSSYDINILVNGSRCKLYQHLGRTYIEAKEGSEYVIEIKNNSWEKVLAVVSVDGLNVLDGDPAETNGAGYVIDKYCSQKLYGYQYAQDKLATFKFGALGATDAQGNKLGYASSKGDGSEKNAGVIGLRIWDEIPQPPISTNAYGMYATSCSYSATASYSCQSPYNYSNPQGWNTTTPDTISGMNASGCCGYSITTANNLGNFQSPGVTTKMQDNSYKSTGISKSDLFKKAIADAKAVKQTACANAKSATDEVFKKFNLQNMVEDHYIPIKDTNAQYCAQAMPEPEQEMVSFDMETQWGQSRTHKVKEVKFQRKSVVHSLDIYYASRDSLIAMGIDLGTEKRVSFPESFKEVKYATPPKGWRG